MKPFFYVVAGPNGVGKSTASFQYLPAGVELINSDDIARQIRQQQTHQEVIQRLTNEAAQARIQQHLSKREPFAVETNLHDAETWQYFKALQQTGYEFRLLFICLDDLPILYQRVINRHVQGGHFVRDDVIRGRYAAGLSLLNHFFATPDNLTLLDASDQLQVVYQRIDGEVTIQQTPQPNWVLLNLADHMTNAGSDATLPATPASIDEIRARYQQQMGKNRPDLPDSPIH
ncbi:hypothetical protein FAES_4862 [Fibrella aestuarina BUZ 2]|uniref:UDP-N-acetylglucosamine kinase n=1 Tax=Fibrella aestuarina BUZ 2 TaxID=1166018 RepID=I0KFF8_9BACT|nr:AAA family ATPase [Fibrella aestuarina]CCH02861.1 hypothetical protein FAES_4862 [Fibrella aestuarina BUZ 2]